MFRCRYQPLSHYCRTRKRHLRASCSLALSLLALALPVLGDTGNQVPVPWGKPGSNVIFSHDYDGTTVVGETESISLHFRLPGNEASAGGKLSLRPEAGLTLEDPQEYHIPPGSREYTVEIHLVAREATKHYLGITLEVFNEFGLASARVFELPILVGGEQAAQAQAQQKPSLLIENRGNTVLILGSEEKIIAGN